MLFSKEAKIRNQYNQVPHLTQDTTWESDKNTIKHNIQESQEVSPFPAGDHEAAINPSKRYLPKEKHSTINGIVFELILIYLLPIEYHF